MDSNDDVFWGQKLEGNESNVEPQKQKVLQGLVKSVENRFADVSSGLLESTKLADSTSWPASYEDDPGMCFRMAKFDICDVAFYIPGSSGYSGYKTL